MNPPILEGETTGAQISPPPLQRKTTAAAASRMQGSISMNKTSNIGKICNNNRKTTSSKSKGYTVEAQTSPVEGKVEERQEQQETNSRRRHGSTRP